MAESGSKRNVNEGELVEAASELIKRDALAAIFQKIDASAQDAGVSAKRSSAEALINHMSVLQKAQMQQAVTDMCRDIDQKVAIVALNAKIKVTSEIQLQIKVTTLSVAKEAENAAAASGKEEHAGKVVAAKLQLLESQLQFLKKEEQEFTALTVNPAIQGQLRQHCAGMVQECKDAQHVVSLHIASYKFHHKLPGAPEKKPVYPAEVKKEAGKARRNRKRNRGKAGSSVDALPSEVVDFDDLVDIIFAP